MEIRRLLLVLAALSFTAAPGHAGPILDQVSMPQSSSAPPGGLAIANIQSVAQTFTVGLSGFLTSIDLALYASAGELDPVTVSIYSTASGIPSGFALYSQTFTPTILPLTTSLGGAFTSFSLASSAFTVNTGDILAIVLSSSGSGNTPWTIWQRGTGTYSGGSQLYTTVGGAWLLDSSDAAFRTYVSVPDVGSSLLLLAVGMAAVGAAGRRFR